MLARLVSVKILHLASANRWTGAAAPAFAEVEALRAAGVEAHYGYVGGYKLEAKISHHDFVHPIIEKAQNPFTFKRSVTAIGDLIRQHGIGIVHAHLTYDHWLARFAVRGTDCLVGRTFHARRVLRSDPFTASLLSRTAYVFVINDGFRDSPALDGRSAVFTPPPVDHRQFTPAGQNVRARYGIGENEPLATVIGKLAPGRGFETALKTIARLPDAKLMIIGHGEHRPVLEALADSLGVASRIVWAGYHEEALADHYRAADLLLFTARGSDEGHRAVLEAMACGVPPVTAPLEGMPALVGPFAAELMAANASPDALAGVAAAVLARRDPALRQRVTEHSRLFGYKKAAERLLGVYQG